MPAMDPQLHTLLDWLAETGQSNDASTQDRRKKMLNLEPATAQLVSLLAQSSRSRQLLEIGTSNGYSTIWLAWAARSAHGRVTSIDRDPDKHALADANLRQAGL